MSRDMFNPPPNSKYQQISLGEHGEVRFLETLSIIIDLIGFLLSSFLFWCLVFRVELIFDFLKDDNLSQKQKVLVICDDGVGKSVSAVLGFLMQFQRCNLLTGFSLLFFHFPFKFDCNMFFSWTIAYRYVKEKQPEARPTIQIMRYLLELESLLLPGTIPSFPLRLYISYYQNYEPFEESLGFINYLDTYEKYLFNFGQFENNFPVFDSSQSLWMYPNWNDFLPSPMSVCLLYYIKKFKSLFK